MWRNIIERSWCGEFTQLREKLGLREANKILMFAVHELGLSIAFVKNFIDRLQGEISKRNIEIDEAIKRMIDNQRKQGIRIIEREITED
jgi:predicted transcriptional regulator